MSLCWLSSCALAALPPLLLGAGEDARSVPATAPGLAGTPVVFAWGDVEGDGRLELAAVSAEGVFQLLAGAGEDRFEDVSERFGLAGISDAALALWVDYDADGRLDLFVGARGGASRLFRNEGKIFVDMTAGAGLSTEGEVRSADWLDHDGDGLADLHVVTAERHELYRGLEGGFFERAELPPLGAGNAGGPSRVELRDAAPDTTTLAGATSDKDGSSRAASKSGGFQGASPSATRFASGAAAGTGGASPTLLSGSCGAASIEDQANPGACLQASTTPTLGRLHPLSTNLFVAASGRVGIGTTSPAARLHVAGTARITNTLTLAPSGDQALDVSTGSIYKGGTLFLHTKGGLNNIALGPDALNSVTTGFANTATGALALQNNTTGKHNTASGAAALQANTRGSSNTASGVYALHSNTEGGGNTASGWRALNSNTIGGNNTASGVSALLSNTTGSGNIAIGRNAGLNTTGNDNIAIGNFGVVAENATIRIGTAGTHKQAFVAGIHGVTTANGNAIAVLVDSAGQLGTVSSSRRFKEDIADMGDRTERLLELRPVVFHYKEEQVLPDGSEVPLEYGLIAEEVAEIFPDLVVNDEEGQPFTVKYHLLSAMLLNELQKQASELEAQRTELARLRRLEARLDALEARTVAGDR